MALWRLPQSLKAQLYVVKQGFSPARCKHWSSQDVRQTFVDYFMSRGHKFVRSSRVVPKKGEGSYFINAGMNQFKPIFLGTAAQQSELASLECAVNSQKCIRIGGKHNDLEEVGRDTYHHTFFEMLGSWSFGSYFKDKACEMAWDLLTNVYKIPPSKLYVTYFGGDPSLGLNEDLESKDVWLKLGVPADRVLPFGSADNFWDMGDTGPCGPCTEIHYDHQGLNDAGYLVNKGDPLMVELWNLVFMQFDRQTDGSLLKLPRQHVDTGMGLERLTAVMQGQVSNYGTDLFTPLLSAMQAATSCPTYQGHLQGEPQYELDTAYRLVADHARMIAVSLADGMRPGKQDTDKKLRQVMYRCVKAGHRVLGLQPGFLASLMPVVTHSLGDSFPELKTNLSEMQAMCDYTEERFLQGFNIANRMLDKALNKLGHSNFSGSDIWEICEGRYGKPVAFEILEELAVDRGVTLDTQSYEEIREKAIWHQQAQEQVRSERPALTQQELVQLRNMEIPRTDDSFKYEATAEGLEAEVVALRVAPQTFVQSVSAGDEVWIFLDKTLFYPEAGGQVSDVGYITTNQGAVVHVQDVQITQNYVLHVGTVQEGCIDVNSTVQLSIDMDRRDMCCSSHTATHVLNYALLKHFRQGDETAQGNAVSSMQHKVQQQSSLVQPNRLHFAFTCPQAKLTMHDLQCITELANQLISQEPDVYKGITASRHVAALPNIRIFNEDITEVSGDSQGEVRVISIGVPIANLGHADVEQITSVEMCCGTHVDNLCSLGSVVVTNCQGFNQGTKRLTAVTGELAQQALSRGCELETKLKELQHAVNTTSAEKCVQLARQCEKILSVELLPKVLREKARETLDSLANKGLGQKKNETIKAQYTQTLESLLRSDHSDDVLVAEFPYKTARDVVDVLASVSPQKPVILFNSPSTIKDGPNRGRMKFTGISYIPKDATISPDQWIHDTFSCLYDKSNFTVQRPKGKYLQRAPTARLFTMELDGDQTVAKVMETFKIRTCHNAEMMNSLHR